MLQVLVESELDATHRTALMQNAQSLPFAQLHVPAHPSADEVNVSQDMLQGGARSQMDHAQTGHKLQDNVRSLWTEGYDALTEQQRNELVEKCLTRNAQVLASLA